MTKKESDLVREEFRQKMSTVSTVVVNGGKTMLISDYMKQEKALAKKYRKRYTEPNIHNYIFTPDKKQRTDYEIPDLSNKWKYKAYRKTNSNNPIILALIAIIFFVISTYIYKII